MAINAIHARLWEFVYRKEGKVNKNDFSGIYEYRRLYGYNWDHQQMATHYREAIADILQVFDNNQRTRQFYMDVAWEGLRYANIHTWSSKSQIEKDRIN
ncbi:MAG: hypothetical protein OIF50_11255, partial [Flavobacteriaceae bacterium]|nr:hypothetical protein [Flavobacteriaceae bacterium]